MPPPPAEDLPTAEKAIEATPPPPKKNSADIRQMFRFASPFDVFLMVLGSLGGLGTGAGLSGFVIIFGDVLDTLNSTDPSAAPGVAIQFVYLGLGVFVAATLQVACWNTAAERMTIKLRGQYLDAILAQEMAWFDQEGPGTLASRSAENSILVRQGTGEKLGSLFMYGGMFFGGIITGLVYVPLLCLVVIAISPVMAISGYIMGKAMADAMTGQLASYVRAGNVAEESLRMIRTVTAFNMQPQQIAKYNYELMGAVKAATKQGVSTGLGFAVVVLSYFCAFAVSMYVGAVLLRDSRNNAVDSHPLNLTALADGTLAAFCQPGGVVPLECMGSNTAINLTFDTVGDVCSCALCRCGCFPSQPGGDYKLESDCITGGDVILTFYAVLMGSFAIGQVAPAVTAFASARAAAYELFRVIDREPAIDASETAPGQVLTECQGEIRFEDVSFQYPTRDQLILKKLNLLIPAGQRVALVGESGSGKSTIIQLIERYYDPQQGAIYLDGIPYKDIQLASLRKLMGLVSQEPVLFATSVMENVRYGRPGATDEEVIEACKQANAHGFISNFSTTANATGADDPYSTFVTSSLVSGGQKQRLAIARALLRNPPILILDEATAALDNESERLVNEAIDKLLLVSRTTIVIAHRLSSIQTCDKIFVLDHGVVVEEGSPSQLAEVDNGHYAALLRLSTAPSSRQLLKAAATPSARALDVGPAIKEEEEEDVVVSPAASDKPVAPSATDAPAAAAEPAIKNYPVRRALQFSYADRWYYIPALLGAIGDGLIFPIFGLLFANMLTSYFLVNSDEIMVEATTWCLAFVGIAVGGAVAVLVEISAFGLVNGRATQRVRTESFRHVMSMEIGYFDLKENNVGAIMSRLGSDCGVLKSAVGDRMQAVVLNLATLVAGLIIAFTGSWKVTLVTLCLVPALALAGYLELTVLSSMAAADQQAVAQSSHTLTEAVGGIRTVAAFEMQSAVSKLYMHQLHVAYAKAMTKGAIGGVCFGLSQAMTYFSYALAFWYGSTLVASGDISFQQLNQSLFGVVMMSMSLGQAMAFFPDLSKGQAAVNSIFSALDRKTLIDPASTAGLKPSVVLGDVSFENVDFAYPSRPEVTVLAKFNLQVQRGQTVAFVGTSGSGKSTLVLLLERFYDPINGGGSVKLDGVDVRDLNLAWLRDQIGIVAQEPSLFQGTIGDNIRHGKPGATQQEVEDAARMANCHDFITSFPLQYDTEVSHSSLSGGQKQRVCIARALIKRPQVLLLDEATSALDEESQRVVQDALDSLLETSSRTTIVVAHRLSTIRNADVIVVMQSGVVVEQGSFEELAEKPNGAFAGLLQAQEKQHQ